MIDWRWRMLYDLIHVGIPDERTAMWRTSCILRARMHTGRKYGT